MHSVPESEALNRNCSGRQIRRCQNDTRVNIIEGSALPGAPVNTLSAGRQILKLVRLGAPRFSLMSYQLELLGTTLG